MRNPLTRFALPALVLLLSVPSASLLAATPSSVDTYKIDGVHSSVGFRVRHLLSKVQGRFGKAEGTVQIDTKDITKSKVDVTIDVASISTNEEKRDAHLKGPDFFDAAKFPTITFKSTAVKEVSKGKLEVTGTFTMKGVSKTIVLPITNLGTAVDPWKNVVAAFEGATRLNRMDYGVSYGAGLVGDDVDIDLNIEAKKAN
ncbi:YceI family protein [Mesoterricola silvestris]|uniref:Lipid/polyisoprenoid-binding YceI-like domain-containing protein n=1 Tax=Mesoterricola silvestris TaxID=2927979 RepID=A0AA48GM18_9BACT|nr:YceI family protein [Mesoterricola silvestris]BDU71965.1 hypothetical protein METEAL_11390 [Mesoterricola silvestris]